MKKPILISLIAVGGAALAAGAIYAVKKLKDVAYCDSDACNFDDCDGCAECSGCDDPCYPEQLKHPEKEATQDESEDDGKDESPDGFNVKPYNFG